MDSFLQEVNKILTKVSIEEKNKMELAAKVMYDSLVKNNLVHVLQQDIHICFVKSYFIVRVV